MVVASPLLSFMRDQVAFLTEHGVIAAMIDASLSEDEKIQRGDVSVVFGSPVMLLAARIEGTPFKKVDSALTLLLLLKTKFTASLNG